jgi:hypothetical protein
MCEHLARFEAARRRAVAWSSVLVRAYPYFMLPILNLIFDTGQARDWRWFKRCFKTYPLCNASLLLQQSESAD